MLDTIRSAAITAFHDACHARPEWPADDAPAHAALPGGALAEAWAWVLVNHRFNCSLWKEEDLARRTQAADAEIAANKRHIDRFNQARNDAMERIDDSLLRATADWPRADDARLSSETAGAMIDRMSILSLKIHHMGLQTVRTDVDEAHRASTRAKVEQLRRQRADLASCYDRLLDELRAGTGCVRIYRQCTMYNDPTLNPALVAERRGRR
ncbi:MAG: DUF4254 domain-containing protein [Burkholderiales bacterium]